MGERPEPTAHERETATRDAARYLLGGNLPASAAEWRLFAQANEGLIKAFARVRVETAQETTERCAIAALVGRASAHVPVDEQTIGWAKRSVENVVAGLVVEKWQAQFESDQIVRAILAAGRSE